MPVLPDALGAAIARLRADVDTLAAAQSRISGRRQDVWPLPCRAIVVQRVGGPGGDYDVLHQFIRVQLDCYGPDDRTAAEVWRTAHLALCPHPPLPNSFTLAHTRVYSVRQEAAPVSLPDGNGQWPRMIAGYILRYSEVAAP